MSDKHRYFVSICGDSYPSVRCECPYDLADETRPCWPLDDDGERDPSGADECNHIAWLDNIGMEMVEGDVEFALPDAWFDWSNGDYPILQLESPVVVPEGTE